MKSKQDILNAFREHFVFELVNHKNTAYGTDDQRENISNWLLTTLTEFEREIKERIKLCAKEQSCSMCMESLSQLEKEKHPSK